jgi:hypothetical protein
VTASWSAVGRLYEGIVHFQLRDCTTGRLDERLNRSLQYPRGSRGTTDAGRATMAVDPGHRYAVRVTGGGSYERRSPAPPGGTGYFSPHPPRGIRPFTAESGCG